MFAVPACPAPGSGSIVGVANLSVGASGTEPRVYPLPRREVRYQTIPLMMTMEQPKDKHYIPMTCSHCEGAGCVYCDKTGCVMVLAPARKCRHCEGDGCIYCGFTGWSGLLVMRDGKPL